MVFVNILCVKQIRERSTAEAGKRHSCVYIYIRSFESDAITSGSCALKEIGCRRTEMASYVPFSITASRLTLSSKNAAHCVSCVSDRFRVWQKGQKGALDRQSLFLDHHGALLLARIAQSSLETRRVGWLVVEPGISSSHLQLRG